MLPLDRSSRGDEVRGRACCPQRAERVNENAAICEAMNPGGALGTARPTFTASEPRCLGCYGYRFFAAEADQNDDNRTDHQRKTQIVNTTHKRAGRFFDVSKNGGTQKAAKIADGINQPDASRRRHIRQKEAGQGPEGWLVRFD